MCVVLAVFSLCFLNRRIRLNLIFVYNAKPPRSLSLPASHLLVVTLLPSVNTIPELVKGELTEHQLRRGLFWEKWRLDAGLFVNGRGLTGGSR